MYIAPALSPESVILSCILLEHDQKIVIEIAHWITPKAGDVPSHPLNSQTLIFERQVSFLAISKAEDIQTVIDSNEDNWLARLDRVSHNLGRVADLGGR